VRYNAALSQPTAGGEDIYRRRVAEHARKLGWNPDDGEGATEYLCRVHYEQGVEDARSGRADRYLPLTAPVVAGEAVASSCCPICGSNTPHPHDLAQVAAWLEAQASRFFVGPEQLSIEPKAQRERREVDLRKRVEWLEDCIRDADHSRPATTPVVAGEAVRGLPPDGQAMEWVRRAYNGNTFTAYNMEVAYGAGWQARALAALATDGEEWIAVTERLPSEYGRYLVYIEAQGDLGRERWIDLVSFGHDRATGDSFAPCGGRITHWRKVTPPAAAKGE
jgi:hypothetical protein